MNLVLYAFLIALIPAVLAAIGVNLLWEFYGKDAEARRNGAQDHQAH